MADRITITPQELLDAASTFTQQAGDIKDILSSLRTLVDNLESTWDGAAQDQFFIAYEEMNTTLEQFPEVLEGIGTQLTTVAQTLEETDQALADSLKG